MWSWLVVSAFLLWMVCNIAPARADDAQDCYNVKTVLKSDPAKAVAACRKLADQGMPKAQFNLGLMYAQGQGLAQSYTEAAKWYRKAADQGYAKALNNLGSLYYSGRGVPKDYVQAYMWVDLAASRGYADAVKNRTAVAAKMTNSQIVQAKALAAAWKPATGQ